MNAFLNVLESNKISNKDSYIRRKELTTLQVNTGNLCNQSCKHCHVDASPLGNRVMSREVIESIIKFLSHKQNLVLDITGGAPELNPHFDYFIINARSKVKEVIVRSNLTVFFEPGKEYLSQFFKQQNVHLICSLPCYTEKNVDLQRGRGVFAKSIEALRLLNKLGYSKLEGLTLDLVYNPIGAYLPPQQDKLEDDYRQNLKQNYGIEFNRLITMTNAPIKRFKDYLDLQGEYDNYLKLLKDNFNPSVVEGIMCRIFLSVGYDGRLYDCDFNQSLGWALKNSEGKFLTIDKVNIKDLENREIKVGEHCLSCTAGYGSSCQGALANKEISLLKDIDMLEKELSAKEVVKSYYGKLLKSKEDLKTSACCEGETVLPSPYREILMKIHPEVRDRFYGCGLPLPPVLQGCTVLDLGCGAGRDVYLASYLVGQRGRVIGVDMTEEQLEVARRYLDYHRKKFGFSQPNVEFKKGYIEDLREIGIENNSVDIVISNCVINLSPDKKAVFSEIFRVLKWGGELYFSDVFTGRRLPEHLKSDPLLYAECLGGALYIEDFRRILRKAGCLDYRIVSKRKITLKRPEIEAKAGMINFYSLTIRTFKLDDLEDICEDYGQVVTYLGTIPNHPHRFVFDEHHIFIAQKPILICGNTASMLENTRYGRYFKVVGDRRTHFGPFNCAPISIKINNEDASAGSACC